MKVNNVRYSSRQNDVTNLFAAFGKKLNPFEAISLYAAYKSVEFNDDDFHVLSYSNSLVDRLLMYSINYGYDTRDYYRNPKFGQRLNISLKYMDYLSTDKESNYGFTIDYRNYKTYGKFTFVNGIFNGNYFNDVIYYQQFIFGENNIIRSHNHRRDFGNNLFIYRNEVRFNVLTNYKLTISLPYVESYLKNMNISSYLYTFFDSGLLYKGISDFTYNNFKSSGGIGLGFMTPYVPYFTFEYGRNAVGHSSFRFSMKLYL